MPSFADHQNREFKVLEMHLRDIKSQGHTDAEIVIGEHGWPVVTFTNKGTRYYYHRGADLFVLDRADACAPGKQTEVKAPRRVNKSPVYRRPCRMPSASVPNPLSAPGKYTLKKYSITAEDYMRMLAEQEGKCAICRRSPRIRRLNIDHCHKRGHVRGLLCYSCNYGLGVFRDAIASFENAVVYLKKNYRA